MVLFETNKLTVLEEFLNPKRTEFQFDIDYIHQYAEKIYDIIMLKFDEKYINAGFINQLSSRTDYYEQFAIMLKKISQEEFIQLAYKAAVCLAIDCLDDYAGIETFHIK